eukprot:TRINITY_DN2348_c0_g1_i1.p1 TRINITY_DN2348_c0_g1~~TRINITY_DN2348_c0_g1_i1.p1  ORF type:complete len:584 (+),score=142.11 TRINITY_DN2348_c0_g1_i1:202-1752(+)
MSDPQPPPRSSSDNDMKSPQQGSPPSATDTPIVQQQPPAHHHHKTGDKNSTLGPDIMAALSPSSSSSSLSSSSSSSLSSSSSSLRPMSPTVVEANGLMECIRTELAPEILRAMRKQKHIDESIHYSGQFEVGPGLYLQVKLVNAEAALVDQVMKRDHFEGVHRMKDKALDEGAPNFRRVNDLPIFGVAQPTKQGIEFVLNYLKKEGFKVIKWINLREEPVCYINGRPYSPRDSSTLNVNLDHLIGIEGLHLEEMEERLKADIMAKVRRERKFEFYHQRIDMGNVTMDEEVPAGALRTPREMFLKYRYDYNLDYHRIPITDECAPEEKDFDELISTLRFASLENAACVFNCQMGRGRTTTGMVVCYLILAHINNKSQGLIIPPSNVPPPDFEDILPANPDYSKGEYVSIFKLISHLEDGEKVKKQVDDAIDACQGMQNLRTAIYDCKVRSVKSEKTDGLSPEEWRMRGKLYLERYWWLILFNSYLVMEVGDNFSKPFSEFMRSRWGIRRLIRKLDMS